jgi:hypothetical protein
VAGKNPQAGLLAIAVFMFAVFWTLALSGGLPRSGQHEPQQTQEGSQNKAAEPRNGDDRLADYTFWLTGFTGLLAFVSGIQGWLLIRADRAATKAARINTETTKRGMDLREKQFALAADQHELAGKQHGLQRLQFYAHYRPELNIQFIRLLPWDTGNILEQSKLGVEFTIINKGGSEANVTGSSVRLVWLRTSEIPTPHEMKGRDVIPHRRFLVGATDRVTMWTGTGDDDVEPPQTGGDALYLMGWVVYVDGRGEEFGSTRTTYFLRQYDRGTEKFVSSPSTGRGEWEWDTTY